MRGEREYHTAVGWWLMTHDRAFGIILACVAAVVAAGSAAYIADRWRSLDGGFERGVVFGGAVLVAMLVASALLRVRSRVPRDRIDARTNARRINVVAVAAIAVAVVGAPSLGSGASVGAVLGEFGTLGVLFVLFSARWALRR